MMEEFRCGIEQYIYLPNWCHPLEVNNDVIVWQLIHFETHSGHGVTIEKR